MAGNGTETRVIIAGVDGRTAPEWATEATLSEFVKRFTAASNDEAKTFKEVIKQFKEMGVHLSKEQAAVIKLAKENEIFNKKKSDKRKEKADEVNKSLYNLKYAGMHSGSSLGKLSDKASALGGVVKSMSSRFGLITGVSTLAAGAIEGMIEHIEKVTQSMLDLYDTGLTFQNGLGELMVASSDAALSVSDSYTGDYLETMRMQGSLTDIRSLKSGEATANYIKNLTAASQILGKPREQIAQESNAFLQDPEVLALVSSLKDNKLFNGLTAEINGSLGAAGLNQFKAGLGSRGITTDLSRAMLTVSPDMQTMFAKLSDKSIGKNGQKAYENENEERTDLKNFLLQLKNVSPVQLAKIQSLVSAGGPGSAGAAQLMAMITQARGADLSKLFDPSKPGSFESSMIAIKNSWAKISTSFEGVFGKFIEAHQGTLDKIANNAAQFADYLAERFKGILEAVGNLFDPATRSAVWESLKTGLSDVAKDFCDALFTELYRHLNPFHSSEYYRDKDAMAASGKAAVATADPNSRLSKWKSEQLANYSGSSTEQQNLKHGWTGDTDSFINNARKWGVDPSLALSIDKKSDPVFMADFNKRLQIATNQSTDQSTESDHTNLLTGIHHYLEKLVGMQDENNDYTKATAKATQDLNDTTRSGSKNVARTIASVF